MSANGSSLRAVVTAPARPARRSVLRMIGAVAIMLLRAVGELWLLGLAVVRSLRRDRQRLSVHFEQCRRIGWDSLVVVTITGAFVGMVVGVQAYVTLHRFNAEVMSGPMVNFTMIQQLAPIMTALVITARVGSQMTAEIGTMKVSEQLDALRVLGTSPISYLVAPRVLALTCMLPLLTAIAALLGILCSAFLLVTLWGVDGGAYWHQASVFVSWWEIFVGTSKTALFGLIIALISCRQGLLTTGGASGVGTACTRAVVQASVTMFVVNLVHTLTANKFYDVLLRPH